MASGSSTDIQGLEYCCTLYPGPEMIDYNGHVNMGYYGILFEDAARAILPRYNLSEDYRKRTNRALFVSEMHITLKKEVFEGQAVNMYLRLVDVTDKVLHAVFFMFHQHDENPAAVQEVLFLHVDLATRKTTPMDAETQTALQELKAHQSPHPLKTAIGRKIDMRAPRTAADAR